MDGLKGESFGLLLRRYRHERGWTQAELAERAQLSIEAISTLERGARQTPWPDTVARLSQALRLNTEERDALVSGAQSSRQASGKTSTSPTPINLPDDPTSFVGREREIAEVAELLQRPQARLVTLTGPGGIGKTRLGIEAARSVGREYQDGVFWVSLAPLSDPKMVPSALAGALAVQPKAGAETLETVIEFLRPKRALLMLDNLEHLLEAAQIVLTLLTECPAVDMLVTSRAPLHLRAEHQYEVSALTLPDPAVRADPAALSSFESVALFTDRAKAIWSDFRLTESNAMAVCAICSSLDGLPLAIELAAARTKLFQPDALLRRLSRRLPLLTVGTHDSPPRHRTIRSAIDWSYSLLDEEERALFARLSVFSGGCTLDAAGPVCDPEGEIDLIEIIASLVDQSLLRREGDGEPRFRMLETIREYATEKLDASGEAEMVRRRHAEYFRDMAHQGHGEWFGPKQPMWVQYFEAEQDNLRAALSWCLQAGQIGLGLALAVDASRHWFTNIRYLREGQRWLERLLEQSGHENIRLRALALDEASWLAVRSGDSERGAALAEASLALGRESGNEGLVGIALTTLSSHVWNQGDVKRAQALEEEGLEIARRCGYPVIKAIALHNLGAWATYDGEFARAIPLLQESAELWRELGDTRCLAFSIRHLAMIAGDRGDLEAAATLLREGLRPLGLSADQIEMALYLEEFAVIAVKQGNCERAVRLWGAAGALRDLAGVSLEWAIQKRHDQFELEARAGIDPARWAELTEEGASMTLQQALAHALEDPEYRLLAPSEPIFAPIFASTSGPPSAF